MSALAQSLKSSFVAGDFKLMGLFISLGAFMCIDYPEFRKKLFGNTFDPVLTEDIVFKNSPVTQFVNQYTQEILKQDAAKLAQEEEEKKNKSWF